MISKDRIRTTVWVGVVMGWENLGNANKGETSEASLRGQMLP